MDTCGVGYVALGEAGPVGNVTVVDSPGPEVLNQLDVRTTAETTRTEASTEMSLPTSLSGFEGSLDEKKLLPEQESLSRLEQQDLSSEMSKVSKPRASKPGRKRGGRTRKGPKRPQQPNPPPAPLAPGLLDQSNPLPTPMPKKRGRKTKAELLLLKLSKGLDQPESPAPKRPPEDFETPPGQRPRRRAAQVALLYLQELAEELSTALPAPVSCPESPKVSSPTKPKKIRQQPVCQGGEEEDDTARDEDFVLKVEAEDGEESEVPSESSSDPEPAVPRSTPRGSTSGKQKLHCRGMAPNGLSNHIMAPVWKCLHLTKNLREQKHSYWEFAEWIPLAWKWHLLSELEAAPYLPQEEKSPLFSVQREGLPEDGTLYRINRFSSITAHPERWDVSFFTGGPLWALDWCPVPEGAAASQYVALFSSPDMNETHSLSQLHSGPGLLQLWGLGTLQQESW